MDTQIPWCRLWLLSTTEESSREPEMDYRTSWLQSWHSATHHNCAITRCTWHFVGLCYVWLCGTVDVIAKQSNSDEMGQPTTKQGWSTVHTSSVWYNDSQHTHTGSVYCAKHCECIGTPHANKLLCPIILYIDKIHIDTNGWFCLEPVTFTLSMFLDSAQNQHNAWRHLGLVATQYITTMDRQNKCKPADNVWHYHAQLDNILCGLVALIGLVHLVDSTLLCLDFVKKIRHMILLLLSVGESNTCVATGVLQSQHCTPCGNQKRCPCTIPFPNPKLVENGA